MTRPKRTNVPVQQQAARRAELDMIRLQRPLTAQEAAESDQLTQRLYMREFRRSLQRPGDSRAA